MKNKVKVALLDTGIDRNHEYLKGNINGGIGFEINDECIVLSNKYDDDNGHGTACASIIKREFEDIEIFSIKILDKNGKSNIQVLEEALKYLINTDIRLINLSLSVMNNELVKDLYNICKKLLDNEKILVCSVANGFKESYPAKFDNVIGVKGFILEDENTYWYNKDENIQCIIDNNSYISCDINNSYKLLGKCNSQAAAKFTGKIANILSEEPNIKVAELYKILEKQATRKLWTEEDLITSKRYPNIKKENYNKDSYILKSCIEIVTNKLCLSNYRELLEYNLFSENIGLTYDRCFEIVLSIEQKLGINIEYQSISRYDFINIYTLASLVEKNLKRTEIQI